jgi:hypothetical protein
MTTLRDPYTAESQGWTVLLNDRVAIPEPRLAGPKAHQTSAPAAFRDALGQMRQNASPLTGESVRGRAACALGAVASICRRAQLPGRVEPPHTGPTARLNGQSQQTKLIWEDSLSHDAASELVAVLSEAVDEGTDEPLPPGKRLSSNRTLYRPDTKIPTSGGPNLLVAICSA